MENEVVLRTHGLSRSFGKLPVVRGVALEVPRGCIYGFLGRNGAGKTTTLRMLMGILEADAGEFEILGERTRTIGPRHRQRLGYVSQEQTFYPWMTATELGRFVGEFFPDWDPAEFRRLLQLLDVPPDRKAAQLSGGTKSKLGLALALAHRPELLLLDEPTAGLDPVARREFLDILKTEVKARGQSVLLSSHLVGEVEEVSHSIGIIQDGVLRFQGPLTTLLEEVRRVRLPPGVEPPAEVEVIRVEKRGEEGWTGVVRSRVSAAELGAAAHGGEALSLEDAFLAYARRSAA